jgi:hypothetical protein
MFSDLKYSFCQYKNMLFVGSLNALLVEIGFSLHFHRWQSSSCKQVNSAAEHNKEPILQALKNFIAPYMEATSNNNCVYYCLEISSGSGQHVVYFAPHFPSVVWQPSDVDASSLRSITAYIRDGEVSNVKQPIFIDITEEHTKWGGGGIIGKLSRTEN